MTASQSWRAQLAEWAIPAHISQAVADSPWEVPAAAMIRRVDTQPGGPVGPSLTRTAEALDPPGTVLDVGAGAGAGSLPVANHITELVAVDEHEALLGALTERAAARGLRVRTVIGRWPDVEASVATVDVVVCHHVFYNVPDLAEFASALDSHARRRVVVELTELHPTAVLNRYWQRLHGLDRPDGPTATDAIAVLHEAGLAPQVERWSRKRTPLAEHFDEHVAITGRMLCLPAHRRDELVALVEEFGMDDTRDVVTLWWDKH
ncbi:MAG TPA: class I SAM-dependent methyltransferase [Micromonosporaceae bacterium]|jgi:precorrin-6B methylase 2|nr:class I SAM-dependent methyltransferase [Micromonosporaceae bacterium]